MLAHSMLLLFLFRATPTRGRTMKQFRVKRQWQGKQGPDGMIAEMTVRELDTTQDTSEWEDRVGADNCTFSVEGEDTINSVINAYGLKHKQSLDGWLHFVPAYTLGSL